MKIVFLSNYYTHHQSALSIIWDKMTNGRYSFVETEEFSEERKCMGWEKDQSALFVVNHGNLEKAEIVELVEKSEYVIWGNAPFSLIKKRVENNGIVFKYSERIFKHGMNYGKWFPRLFTFWWNYGKYKNLYLLSAGAYTTRDYVLHGVFRNKSYKWGYFPETKYYNIDNILKEKEIKKILWCGRFIEWKHPEAVIEIAKRLKADKLNFEINLIGSGKLEEKLYEMIKSYDLSNCVKLLGAMSPEEVRKHMEKAGIFLFTSDFAEGWGAVLNEAMNSGCAVIASHAIGSVPFLLKHRQNGMIYENGNLDDLYNKVKYLLNNPGEQKNMGNSAYDTIVNIWNAEVAAKRFLVFAEKIKKYGYCDLYKEGPCSEAVNLKNNWFKEKDLWEK